MFKKLILGSLMSVMLLATASYAAPMNQSYIVSMNKWVVEGFLFNQSDSIMNINGTDLRISAPLLKIDSLPGSAHAPYQLKLAQDQQTLVIVQNSADNGCKFVFNPAPIDSEGDGTAKLSVSKINDAATCDADNNAGLKVSIFNAPVPPKK